MQRATRLEAVREQAHAAVWGEGVRLARAGAVRGVEADDDGITVEVKEAGRVTPFEVWLGADGDSFDCACGRPLPCAHVCAAAIASSTDDGLALPEASEAYRVDLRYDFRTAGHRLAVSRTAVWADGRTQLVDGALADLDAFADRRDMQAESLLLSTNGGPLDEELLRRLLLILEGEGQATLDGAPIPLGREAIPFVVKIRDAGQGFQAGVYRPAGLDALFLGAAVRDGHLHPTTYGTMPDTERRALLPTRRERVFGADQAGWLVTDYLPRLRSFDLPVDVETTRLPTAEARVPRVELALEEQVEGLSVRATLVYGDPPVARVEQGRFVKLGEVVPVRDPGAERRIARAFEAVARVPVGVTRRLAPGEAAQFLEQVVPRLTDVTIRGDLDPARFRVRKATLQPHLDVSGGEHRPADAARSAAATPFTLDVSFSSDDGARAEPADVLRAWRLGRRVVPLVDGGFAPLPADWLKRHGALLEELLAARDREGRVPRHATAALVELMDDTQGHVPPDLQRLHDHLRGGDGLPEVDAPPGLCADLRPYQLSGYRWLRFLRDMELHGVLADDMGLGKTLQTLAVLLDTPGPHLVVAPTSVIPTWAREAARFAPALKVCVYHGPDRVLDPEADLVITSYALLRLDRARLGGRRWSYAVLDEAQAIKNPDAQTSKAAFALDAAHRLAVTGTPVENHLEELWSLFRFLMPGWLGPRDTFRQRFVKPIEVGDAGARDALRQRVRPYVLRRRKKQVATDLPALTQIVERCPLPRAQREVYEAVRAAARRDVWLALSKGRGWQMEVLEALLRMRQACCDPTLLPGAQPDLPAAKLDRLEEMLVDLVTDGHKALVFSQWTSLLDRVEPRLRALGIPFVRLDGTTRDRQAVIDAFQADDGAPVFLLSLKAGGTGLTLTAADYVIHLDPWWNPAVEQQATDRAHRIGQDKPVVSVKLIAEDTVEERILALQESKRELAEVAVGDEGGFVRGLNADELRALFDAA